MAPFPFGQATVRGLLVMPPPQATPAQPIEVGATIWRRVSNGPEESSGIAIRNTMFEGDVENWLRQASEKPGSQNLDVAWRLPISAPWAAAWPSRSNETNVLRKQSIVG